VIVCASTVVAACVTVVAVTVDGSSVAVVSIPAHIYFLITSRQKIAMWSNLLLTEAFSRSVCKETVLFTNPKLTKPVFNTSSTK